MKYKLKFTSQAGKDLERHRKSGDKVVHSKILTLLDELKEHPRTGTGKPEPLLGNRKGQWSRRINQTHRLIYRVEDEVITVEVVSAFGHYGYK
jgi:toxin YoeB